MSSLGDDAEKYLEGYADGQVHGALIGHLMWALGYAGLDYTREPVSDAPLVVTLHQQTFEIRVVRRAATS